MNVFDERKRSELRICKDVLQPVRKQFLIIELDWLEVQLGVNF